MYTIAAVFCRTSFMGFRQRKRFSNLLSEQPTTAMSRLFRPALVPVILLALLCCCFSCQSQPGTAPSDTEETASLQEVLQPNDTLPYPVYESFDQIAPLLNRQDDTVYVVNFWATWCKPCVEELPYFERLAREMEDRPVKIVMVSLDFRRDVRTKLLRFVRERPLDLPVVALTDQQYHNWIDRVSNEWGGAIPATVIYRKGARFFHPDQYASYAELQQAVLQLL